MAGGGVLILILWGISFIDSQIILRSPTLTLWTPNCDQPVHSRFKVKRVLKKKKIVACLYPSLTGSGFYTMYLMFKWWRKNQGGLSLIRIDEFLFPYFMQRKRKKTHIPVIKKKSQVSLFKLPLNLTILFWMKNYFHN